MSNSRFKCTDSTVANLYDVFDKLFGKDEKLLKILKSGEEISINKNFFEEEYMLYNCKKIKEDLEKGTLALIKAEGIFDNGDLVSDLPMLKEVNFNKAYFYKSEDVCRSSEDYCILGESCHYSNSDMIFPPKSVYDFGYICEVRDEYKSFIDNGYKKVKLPNCFSKIMGNDEYRDFFRGMIEKGFTVNKLFENRGSVFCRNRFQGHKALDYLEGLESDFYNELLELVVGLGKPVNAVYFYSDLNWTCMLYRPSKVEGEYEIVLK